MTVDARLTDAEIRVIEELARDGPTNPQIAQRLFTTEQTIKFHINNMMRKTKTPTRVGLVLWWIRGGQYLDHGTIKRLPISSRVLALLDGRPLRAKDVAAQLEIEYRQAATSLGYLRKRGRVERVPGEGWVRAR